MDQQERTRKSMLITMGGLKFYETYLQFNKHLDDEYKETKGYQKPKVKYNDHILITGNY